MNSSSFVFTKTEDICNFCRERLLSAMQPNVWMFLGFFGICTKLFCISSHLPHEMLPVYFSCAVCLQFEMGGRTRWLVSFWQLCRLMIGPLNPVATELGQKDEWKRTNATQHLNWKVKV